MANHKNGRIPGMGVPGVLLEQPRPQAPAAYAKVTNEIHLNPRIIWSPSIDELAPSLGIRTNDGQPPAVLSFMEDDVLGNPLIRNYAINRDQAAWVRERLTEYLDGEPAGEAVPDVTGEPPVEQPAA